MEIVLTLAIGLLAGSITGMVGSSGVMVVVPALIMIGYAPAQAIGASLFIDTVASLVVAWTYYQHKNLVLKDGFWIAVGSMVGAQAGSYLSTVIPGIGLSGSFNLFLFISAAFMWSNGKRSAAPEGRAFKGRRARALIEGLRRRPRVSGAALGLFVGLICGFVGAGGGMMILLILVVVMDFAMHEGIGTSTLIMAFTAFSGTVGHIVTKDLPLDVAIFGTVGTVVGGRISARFANRIKADILGKIGAGIFFALGIAMFFVNGSLLGK